MTNEFKVGCNFDMNLISICRDMNDEYRDKGRVVEMYGSDQDHCDLAARPAFRLQDISEQKFAEYVRELEKVGITFNYTMNSPFPYATKTELLAHKQEIQDFAKKLQDIGVYRITVANPMMALFIREVSDIELELSTIAHLDTVTQIKFYHELFGINKVCGNILKNRDKAFLSNAANYCNNHGIIYELMAQEFCYNSFKKEHSATHCIFRDSCYLCHAGNKTKEEAEAYNNYPMGYCITSRNGEEEGWLKSRWIRPEDLHFYNEIGLHHFKLTGRTGSTEFLKTVIEAYLSEHFEGNILQLWKPLETIYSYQRECEYKFADNIPNEKLDGFLDHWFDGNGFKCEDEMCGETCNYCRNFYLQNIK